MIFLDADDVLHPQAAARVAAAFAEDESLTRVQFRMDVIDAEGRATGVIKPAEHLPMPQGRHARGRARLSPSTSPGWR